MSSLAWFPVRSDCVVLMYMCLSEITPFNALGRLASSKCHILSPILCPDLNNKGNTEEAQKLQRHTLMVVIISGVEVMGKFDFMLYLHLKFY